MIDNRKLLITVTALALAGVLALFLYSTTIKPMDVPLRDIDKSHVGKIITTTGTVTDARTLSDGSLSLGVGDPETSKTLEVYFPSGAYESWNGGPLVPGTVVSVTGEVILYQEKLEISLSSAGDMIVISGSGETRYDLWTIMDSVEMFDGMEVRTNGTMTDMTRIYGPEELIGTSFRITQVHDNQTYSLECMCFDRTLEQFEEYDRVTVMGEVDFYSNKGCWQLIVEIVEPEQGHQNL